MDMGLPKEEAQQIRDEEQRVLKEKFWISKEKKRLREEKKAQRVERKKAKENQDFQCLEESETPNWWFKTNGVRKSDWMESSNKNRII